jgi:hypothetical protein
VPYDILQHPHDDDMAHTAPFLQHLSGAEDQVLHIVHPDGTTHPMSFTHITLMQSPSVDGGSMHHPPMMIPNGMLPHKINATAAPEADEKASAISNSTSKSADHQVVGSPLTTIMPSLNKTVNATSSVTATSKSANGTAASSSSTDAAEAKMDTKAVMNSSPSANSTTSGGLSANTTAAPAPASAPVSAATNDAAHIPVNAAVSDLAKGNVTAAVNATAPSTVKKVEDPDVSSNSGKANATVIPTPPPTSAEPDHKVRS